MYSPNGKFKIGFTNVNTDNTKNVINAVQSLSNTTNYNISDVTCAAHSLQLSINKALKEDSTFEILNLYENTKICEGIQNVCNLSVY